MRIYLLLMLGLIAIVAGCTNNIQVDSNNGLVINEFTAEPQVAEYNDNVRLFLDVENIGGTTATCVTSTLFGVDGWYDALTGAPLSMPVIAVIPEKGLTFNIFSGGLDFCYFDIMQGKQICASYRKGGGFSLSAFIGDNFLSFTNQFCSAANLYSNQIDPSNPTTRLARFQQALTPPSPLRNKAGQSWTTEWILKPPRLPEGLKVTYPIIARTAFFYTSNAHVNIMAFNKDEAKRRELSGDASLNTPLVVENVHGAPIQLQVTRGDGPMIINQDPLLGHKQYFSYTFELLNTGQGYPLPSSGVDLPGMLGPQTESGYVWAVATINGPGAYFENCLGQSGQEILVTPDLVQNLLKIRADKTAPFGCQIAVQRDRWIDTPVGTVSITFQIFYRYYIDKETAVTVVGPERF